MTTRQQLISYIASSISMMNTMYNNVPFSFREKHLIHLLELINEYLLNECRDKTEIARPTSIDTPENAATDLPMRTALDKKQKYLDFINSAQSFKVHDFAEAFSMTRPQATWTLQQLRKEKYITCVGHSSAAVYIQATNQELIAQHMQKCNDSMNERACIKESRNELRNQICSILLKNPNNKYSYDDLRKELKIETNECSFERIVTACRILRMQKVINRYDVDGTTLFSIVPQRKVA